MSQARAATSIPRKNFRTKPASPSLHYLLSLALFVCGISSCVCMCQRGYERLETCCETCETKTDTKCRECGAGSASSSSAAASREEDYNLRDFLPEWYVGKIFSQRERDFWNDFGKTMTTCNVPPEWIQAQIVTGPVDASVSKGLTTCQNIPSLRNFCCVSCAGAKNVNCIKNICWLSPADNLIEVEEWERVKSKKSIEKIQQENNRLRTEEIPNLERIYRDCQKVPRRCPGKAQGECLAGENGWCGCIDIKSRISYYPLDSRCVYSDCIDGPDDFCEMANFLEKSSAVRASLEQGEKMLRDQQNVSDNLISRQSDIATHNFTNNKDGSYVERLPDGSVSREEFAILAFKRHVIYVGKDGFLNIKELGNIPNTHFDLLDEDRNGRLSRKEINLLSDGTPKGETKKRYSMFASETFRPNTKCLKIDETSLSRSNISMRFFLHDYPLFSSSFLFNGALSKYTPGQFMPEEITVSDTLREEWGYQTLVKSGVIKPSDGVVAGYVICVIYVFVIASIWSFRKKQKDGAQSTSSAVQSGVIFVSLVSGVSGATDSDNSLGTTAPRAPVTLGATAPLVVTSVPEEVSCESKKNAKKTIIWNIVTMIVGVAMYQVLFWRTFDERMQDDTLEDFGIFVVVTTVTLWRDSLDIIISSCRPNEGDSLFKQISVVNDINGINLCRPQELFAALVFLGCDWVILLMLVLSSLLVDPWYKTAEETVCPSVERWLVVTYGVIPAIIIFLGIQALILRNAATRTTMTRNLPIYEIVTALTFTSVITFWGPLKAHDLQKLNESGNKTYFENCEIVWFSSISVVVILWTDVVKAVLQYFYLAGTSLGYLDKSKVNILVTFFKKSISQKRFDCFVMFLVFAFVTISGNLAAPLVNDLGQRLRNSPSREERMNSICTKRQEMCPSLNFNNTFPCPPDRSVVTPEIYDVDYLDLKIKIPLECYLEAHIDLQLGNYSEFESNLLMDGSGYENSRQNPAIPVFIMGLALLFLTLWALFDRKRIQEVLNGNEVEYINGEEI